MLKTCLSLSAQNPVLLDKGHHLTKLIVMDAHLCAHHNGVKETVAELRYAYCWLKIDNLFIGRSIAASLVSIMKASCVVAILHHLYMCTVCSSLQVSRLLKLTLRGLFMSDL